MVAPHGDALPQAQSHVPLNTEAAKAVVNDYDAPNGSFSDKPLASK